MPVALELLPRIIRKPHATSAFSALCTLKVKEGWHSFHPELPNQKIWGYEAFAALDAGASGFGMAQTCTPQVKR